ncbi:histidine kinase dimerization/phospho-acceptor domain-containing protein [Desulfoscipio geothermicus]|uniref:histidine kinase n=1 Tax=Desulfoscipio geothermicus DSM 3669 TaxID=1121426 RepID=A0A1I6D5G3_9FIRM|nr:histidine kinase dimerization/phospho-acceptor domain-containing protein [Desulfoscipio geothermicus]SFR00547.1 His Kinase A (phospho-acceptor) domain-containing protein [Desulfoscipio geothermicus DSM 3669]
MAVFIPVGRQQELENAIIKAEKLAILGQLAAVAVHEIRNPLTTINGFLQLLQKDLQGTPKEEYLSIMLSELKHVNRLISEFLHLARPGYSKRTHCSINKLIREVLILVESEASIHNLEIILETSTNIPPILADDEQIHRTTF